MTTLQFAILLFCTITFGLIIGAYYGTIEYRIRNDLPLITKDCFCPICKHPLSTYHQIPIMGWLVLHGHCHNCGGPISLRYPLFESLFGLFYTVTFLFFHHNPLILLIIWFCFITIMLIIRSHKHFLSLFKGIGIMYLYHSLYGFLLLIICTPE